MTVYIWQMLPSVFKRHLITRLMVALKTDKLSINQLIAWSVWLQQLKLCGILVCLASLTVMMTGEHQLGCCLKPFGYICYRREGCISLGEIFFNLTQHHSKACKRRAGQPCGCHALSHMSVKWTCMQKLK